MTQPDAGVASEPVTLINAFTVPERESARFLQRWKDNTRVIIDQPGFVRARLYRCLAEDAEPRFVNVAEWQSLSALSRATATPAFHASTRRLLEDPELHVTARPAIYQVALELQPGDRI